MPEGAIFMGASAGGIEAVEEVISQIPASLPAPVFVVSTYLNLQETEDHTRAQTFFAKAREFEKRSKTFHGAVLNHDSLSADNLGQESTT
jgi:chemotaxis response regulator CheB